MPYDENLLSAPLTCPECGRESLELVCASYSTGIAAPDGYQESWTQELVVCQSCRWWGTPEDFDLVSTQTSLD